MKQDMIVILDLGSEENPRLAREIRALGVYSEIHPHDLTLKRLEKSGAKIYSTQDNGAVAVTVRKKLCGFTVETVELKVGIQYTFKR